MKNPTHSVSGRALHAQVKAGRDFAKWAKDQIARHQLQEGKDYVWTIDTARKRSEAKFTHAAAKKISSRYKEQHQVKAHEISTVVIKKDSSTSTTEMTKSQNEATEIEPVDTSPIQAIATAWTEEQTVIQTIDGLDLYRRLKSINHENSGGRYRDWIKSQIKRCELREGIDYLETQENLDGKLDREKIRDQERAKFRSGTGHGGDRRTISYKLSISAAKHIAIVQKGAAAARVRKNLIQAEEQISAIQARQLSQARSLLIQIQEQQDKEARLNAMHHPMLGSQAIEPSLRQIQALSCKYRTDLTGKFRSYESTLSQHRNPVTGDYRVNRAIKAMHLTAVLVFEKNSRTIAQRVKNGMDADTVVRIGVQDTADEIMTTIETFYKEINASEEELPLALLVELMQQSIR